MTDNSPLPADTSASRERMTEAAEAMIAEARALTRELKNQRGDDARE